MVFYDFFYLPLFSYNLNKFLINFFLFFDEPLHQLYVKIECIFIFFFIKFNINKFSHFFFAFTKHFIFFIIIHYFFKIMFILAFLAKIFYYTILLFYLKMKNHLIHYFYLHKTIKVFLALL